MARTELASHVDHQELITTLEFFVASGRSGRAFAGHGRGASDRQLVRPAVGQVGALRSSSQPSTAVS